MQRHVGGTRGGGGGPKVVVRGGDGGLWAADEGLWGWLRGLRVGRGSIPCSSVWLLSSRVLRCGSMDTCFAIVQLLIMLGETDCS